MVWTQRQFYRFLFTRFISFCCHYVFVCVFYHFISHSVFSIELLWFIRNSDHKLSTIAITIYLNFVVNSFDPWIIISFFICVNLFCLDCVGERVPEVKVKYQKKKKRQQQYNVLHIQIHHTRTHIRFKETRCHGSNSIQLKTETKSGNIAHSTSP